MRTKYKDISLKDLVNNLIRDLKIDTELYEKQSIQQQIRRTAKKYPVAGDGSYFSTAQKNGKKYSEEAIDEIIRLNENYLSERSSDPIIKSGGFYMDIRKRRKIVEKELNELEIIETLKEAYRFTTESSVIPFWDIYTSFKEKHSRPPFDLDEFYAFIDLYMEMNHLEIDDEHGLLQLRNIPAPSISKKDLSLLNSDYHYEPIYQEEDEDDPFSEQRIVGIRKRSYSSALNRVDNEAAAMMIQALYELFFKPVNTDMLLEDLYISAVDYPEHKRLDIYSDAVERLKDYHNYCEKKDSPVLENYDYEYFALEFRKIETQLKELKRIAAGDSPDKD